MTVSVPSAAPTRSASPLRPEPGLACAPPLPSSRTSTEKTPFSRAIRTDAVRRLGVLGDVGQRLGDREVGGRLGRRRQPVLRQLDDVDRQRRARDERRDRGRQAALGQHGRVDAARQLAQLGRGVGQLLADALEERAGEVRVLLDPRPTPCAPRAPARPAAAARRRAGRARSCGARRRPPRRCARARRAAPRCARGRSRVRGPPPRRRGARSRRTARRRTTAGRRSRTPAARGRAPSAPRRRRR